LTAQQVPRQAREVPPGSLDDAVVALRELVLAAEYYGTAAAKTLGVSVSDNLAVSYLMSRGPMAQTELARALGLAPGSVTILVDRLEANGLARRRPDPHDRRRLRVELVDQNSHVVEELRSWLVDVCEQLSPADRKHVSRLLGVLATGLRERSEQAAAG
jgi:DNA-binding MarR family transcriptional regulator